MYYLEKCINIISLNSNDHDNPINKANNNLTRQITEHEIKRCLIFSYANSYTFALKIQYYIPSQGKWSMFYIFP